MKRYIIAILLGCSMMLMAQQTTIENGDSLQMSIQSSKDRFKRSSKDTLIVLQNKDEVIIGDTIAHDPNATWDDGWRPIPSRAVWLGALLPGLGQIYNRSYWKLPIVYGGLMGCTYAIVWNGSMYKDYRQAYIDICEDVELSTDPNRSYNLMLPKGYTIEMMGGRDTYTKTLKDRYNMYRRYRDFGIVACVGVYALSIIDAFVDAQLFDFDISPDLSMNVSPQIYNDYMNRRSAELHLAFTIK